MYLIKSNASKNTSVFKEETHLFLEAYLMREASTDNISSSSVWCNNCILDPMLPKCKARERRVGAGDSYKCGAPPHTKKHTNIRIYLVYALKSDFLSFIERDFKLYKRNDLQFFTVYKLFTFISQII
jgi:hypothetical protein